MLGGREQCAVFAKVIRRIKAVSAVSHKTGSTMLAVETRGILTKAGIKSDVTMGNVYLAIAELVPRTFATSIVRRALGHSSLTGTLEKTRIGLRHTVTTSNEFNKRVISKRISKANEVIRIGGSSGTV